MHIAYNEEYKPTSKAVMIDIQAVMRDCQYCSYEELKIKVPALADLADNEIAQAVQDSGYTSIDDGIIPDVTDADPELDTDGTSVPTDGG